VDVGDHQLQALDGLFASAMAAKSSSALMSSASDSKTSLARWNRIPCGRAEDNLKNDLGIRWTTP